jgi:hypothetical protein
MDGGVIGRWVAMIASWSTLFILLVFDCDERYLEMACLGIHRLAGRFSLCQKEQFHGL